MKLTDMIALQSAEDPFYTATLQTPLGRFHPPSLKNPILVPQELPSDGWQPGASKKARAQAIADLILIVQRSKRNGKPEIGQTTLVNPDLWRRW